MPVTSGRRHLPGATRYQPRVMTVPWSSKPNAAITTLRVSLHQAKPALFGFCAAAISMSKKSARPAAVFSSWLSAMNCASAASVFSPRTPSIGPAS